MPAGQGNEGARPVFISYSRRASREVAVRLFEALGGREGIAFLDSEGIEYGERIPDNIVEALLHSRVVVVVAEPTYFSRWYCLLELSTALAEYSWMLARAGTTRAERDAALDHIVVVLPADGDATVLENFPPDVRNTNWPRADSIDSVVRLIRERLSNSKEGLGVRLERSIGVARITAILSEAALLPPPVPLSGVLLVPESGIRPSLGPGFLGRAEDLWRVHYALTTRRGDPTTTAPVSVLVEAPAGSGKTRLALEYMHRFGRSGYGGGLFWIDAEGNVESQQYEILKALAPQSPDLGTLQTEEGGVARRLATALRQIPAEDPALVVVDNIPEPQQGTAPRPLSDWCPAVGQISLLATSRLRLSIAGGTDIVPVPLDVLEPAPAMMLLTQQIGRHELADEEWDQVSNWVGRMPLALEILNRAVRVGAVSPRELLEHSQRGSGTTAMLDAAMQALRAQVPASALRGISETLLISYTRLTIAQQRAFRMLGHLSHDPIPVTILDSCNPPFDRETRAALRARSLVSEPLSSRMPLYGSVHRVVADFARSIGPESEALEVAAAVATAMSNERMENPADLPLMALVLPHARALWVRLSSQHLRDPSVARLGWASGAILQEQGSFAEAFRAFQDLTQKGAAQGFTEVELQGLLDEASVLTDLGRHREAVERERYVLEARQRALGFDHDDTLTAANNLAVSLDLIGDLPAAIGVNERILTARIARLGKRHPHTMTTMHNLGLALHKVGGTGEERGRDLLKEALSLRMEVLGPEHPETLMTRRIIATRVTSPTDPSQARAVLEDVLRIQQEISGEEHPDTLRAKQALAYTLMLVNEGQRAEELRVEILDGTKKVFGEEDLATIAAAVDLANVRVARGNHRQALETLEKALSQATTLGHKSPVRLRVLHHASLSMAAVGDYGRALEAAREVVAIGGELLGEGHPIVQEAAAQVKALLGEGKAV